MGMTAEAMHSETAQENGRLPPVVSGYKQTSLGVLPSDWSTCSLGEIGQCLIGLTYEPRNISSDGLLVLRSSNIGDGNLQFDDHVFVNMEVPERIIVREDDLLICVRNGSRPLIGKCALIDLQAVGMTFGAFMSVFRSANNRFVFYCFQSDIVRHQIHEHLGATINQITNRSLNSFVIPYPRAEERDAIAEALSDVDGLLGALEALIAKKRAIKQAAMQQLLTGKTRLPGFSGEWELGKLADYGVFRSGGGFPLVFQGCQSGDYPFFKVSDISNKGNELLLKSANHWINEDARKTLGATKFPAGSVVFAKIGAAIFLERKRLLSRESCLDNNMMAFSLTAPVACERFFHYLFLRIKLGKLVSITALPSLSSREIGAICVPLPPLDEQRAIAAVLSDMDAEIAALERRRDKTRAVKQGMMQQLLTGQVRLVKPR